MTWGSHMSNFHDVTQYGSKIRHATVTGVTCDTVATSTLNTSSSLSSPPAEHMHHPALANIPQSWLAKLSQSLASCQKVTLSVNIHFSCACYDAVSVQREL